MLKEILKSVPFLTTALFFASCASTGTFVDSRDGKTYKTVQIGEQIWMAENMNYKTKEGSHCFECKKYGRLYDWYAAQDACPEGWHLPTKKEWKSFYSRLEHPEMLKASSDWNNYNINDIDYYSFSVLPAGRYSEGNLKERGNYAQFWSADVSEGPYFIPGDNTKWSEILGEDAAVSVRCIQGNTENSGVIVKRTRPKIGEFIDPRDGKRYKTIEINDQEWMAQNLNYETNDSRCLPENGTCEDSGLSYVWNDAKEACPEGWHIPDDGELKALATYFTGSDSLPCGSSYDSFGYRNKKKATFDSLGFQMFTGARFWSSTPEEPSFKSYSTWKFQTYTIGDWLCSDMNVIRHLKRIDDEAAVRCIRGAAPISPLDEKMAEIAKRVEELRQNNKAKSKHGSIKDSRDGKTYGTVKIGNQTWMSENLSFSTKRKKGYNYNADGNIIDIEEVCYANNAESCSLMGTLYSVPGSLFCPDGWHVPTHAEWSALAHSIKKDHADIFEELSIIPSGYGVRDNIDNYAFDGLGNDAYFWKMDSSGYSVIHLSKDSTGDDVITVLDDKFRGVVPIRCVENSAKGAFKDVRDGKTYKTVKYGNKTWMAENLNYKTNGSYCYDNDNSNCKNKGRLYTWAAAKNACPTGWRLPTMDELTDVFDLNYGLWTPKYGTKSHTSKFLARGAWSDSTTNDFSFSIIPSGLRNINGSYQYGKGGAYIWSSTQDPKNEQDDDYYFYVGLPLSGKESGSEFLGLSVRCIKK